MKRAAVALIATTAALALFASSSLGKGDPDGQYRAPGNPTTIYVNNDGRMISYFVSYVRTSCPVGTGPGHQSQVIVQTSGKAKISVSRKGRFSATVPFKDVQGFPNSGVAAVSGKLKGKRITGHIEGSNSTCSFAADVAVPLGAPAKRPH
jgi:hypothetical protein